jgi:hypothetical protein
VDDGDLLVVAQIVPGFDAPIRERREDRPQRVEPF